MGLKKFSIGLTLFSMALVGLCVNPATAVVLLLAAIAWGVIAPKL